MRRVQQALSLLRAAVLQQTTSPAYSLLPVPEALARCSNATSTSTAATHTAFAAQLRAFSSELGRLPRHLSNLGTSSSAGRSALGLVFPLPANAQGLRHASSSVPQNIRPGNRLAPNPPLHQTLQRYPLFQNRKPAVKRPAAHQWRFCDANYDPMTPAAPDSRLPHYAPPWARKKDYRALDFEHKPVHSGRNRCDVGR